MATDVYAVTMDRQMSSRGKVEESNLRIEGLLVDKFSSPLNIVGQGERTNGGRGEDKR